MNRIVIYLVPLSFAVNAECTLQGDVYPEGAKLGNLVCKSGEFTSIRYAEPVEEPEEPFISRNGIHVSASQETVKQPEKSGVEE
ncbi:hypothetical protein F9L16_02335 [Agarivorans sp. B2Z047]|uniref:hypothetical protein n=1 Tax=Agarivorans sp. B2Z047 TaxID=2652721 RepID=UPI00128B8687|nr:hypothetical protein [Agarivorans sp. B2Z047]MPW27832.1 hypothetical protein [Agarivorans sp. B2Z047]UQN44332.1 hypothetical protein LQZ07_07625 [Agarivorans sp. B2Z047]